MRRLIFLSLLLMLLSPSARIRGQGQGPASQPMNAARFDYLDIYLDPHGTRLAAYQFELTVDPNAATIVGVEGGEHAAFRSAPYYDPAALTKNRIIVAAFNTGPNLPNINTRIARLHLRITRPNPDYHVRLDTAAGANGGEAKDAVISLGTGAKP